jgi:hypothetical protein
MLYKYAHTYICTGAIWLCFVIVCYEVVNLSWHGIRSASHAYVSARELRKYWLNASTHTSGRDIDQCGHRVKPDARNLCWKGRQGDS